MTFLKVWMARISLGAGLLLAAALFIVTGKWLRAAQFLEKAEEEVDVLKAREQGTKDAAEAQAQARQKTEDIKRENMDRPPTQRPTGGIRRKRD